MTAKKIKIQAKKIVPAAIFILGLGLGALFGKQIYQNKNDYFAIKRLRLYSDNTHLSNPLIQVEGPAGGDRRLEAAKKEISAYVNRRLKEKKAAQISVYLRDLNQGTWAGIEEDEPYTIASLAKVPLMFTFFIKAEQDPALLQKKITYDKEIDTNWNQNIPPQNSPQLGQTYTVEELLKNMTSYSDNVSMILLAQNKGIDEKRAEQIFSDLRLAIPDPQREYSISPKDYARYFRLLYNATYLSNESSEKALRLLTVSDFSDGIVAGVPPGVTVAHKFGERGDALGAQLHDCGIVYSPQTPYVICVMTRGWDFQTLRDVIKNISGLAYKHFEANPS